MGDKSRNLPRGRGLTGRAGIAIWSLVVALGACGPAGVGGTATQAGVSLSPGPMTGIALYAVATRDGVDIVGVGAAPHSRDTRLAVVRTTDGGSTWSSSTAEIPALQTLTWAGDRLIGATSSVCASCAISEPTV